MWPWSKKKESEEVLKPGKCECTHPRCGHEKGRGPCHTYILPCDDVPRGSECACQIFIRDDDDDDGDADPEPQVPTPSELERLYQR